jgi:hypothetical protein
MAIRILSAAALSLGALLSALFYVMAPMAMAVACVQAPCPPMQLLLRLIQSSLPFGISVALVATAFLVGRKQPRAASAILAVPLILISAWVAGLFVASLLGQ